MNLVNNPTSVLQVFILLVSSFSCSVKENTLPEQQLYSVTISKETIRHEMRQILDKEFAAWYPRSIDSIYGGFFSDMNYTWELDGEQNKMIVTQARHVWSAANAFYLYKGDSTFLTIARHGFEYLKNTMWDNNSGGFYDLVDRQGKPISQFKEIIKQAYGNAFAIYGLASYYKASGNTEALLLAQEAFQWMEKHSYDPQYGGYFQFMKRDGSPFTHGYDNTPPKDYNSMIHILECFTELYKVWPDSILKARLHSMLILVRDTLVSSKGFLKLYFNQNWKHVPNRNNFQLDHVSFGHDVETAYLMLEAAEILKIENDTTTLKIAKKMVDHALANGFDKEKGGLYDGGYYYHNEQITILRNTKEWWSQVEAFNTFLLMAEIFPDDNHNYFEKFCVQWNYCMNYVIDHNYNGWYWGGIDIDPKNTLSPKGSIWKGNYHTSRALINCINTLKK